MRILITGGTSGIGRAVAMERAARGHEVHVVARDPAKLAALRRDLNGAAVEVFAADLSSVPDIKRFARAYRSAHIGLDLLFLNAGIFLRIPETNDDGSDRAFVVNYLHRFLLTVLLNPLLRSAEQPRVLINGDPRLVPALHLDADVFGRGYPAVRGATQALAANTFLVYWLNRVFATGVPISLINPGYVRTNMVTQGGTFLRALARLDLLATEPAEAARGIAACVDTISPQDGDGRFFKGTKEIRRRRKVAAGPGTFHALWRESCALSDIADPCWPSRAQ